MEDSYKGKIRWSADQCSDAPDRSTVGNPQENPDRKFPHFFPAQHFFQIENNGNGNGSSTGNSPQPGGGHPNQGRPGDRPTNLPVENLNQTSTDIVITDPSYGLIAFVSFLLIGVSIYLSRRWH